LSALPSSFIAAPNERSPSVDIFSADPWRLSAFFHQGERGALVAGLGNVALEDLAGEHGTEPVPPDAHCLLAQADPAPEQQVLDESHIHHHDQADHLGR
jgi:hypothetical protein